MIKKILIIIAVLGAIGLAFSAGWKLKAQSIDNDYNASVTPASDLANSVREGQNLDSVYNSTSNIYQESTSLEEFKVAVTPLKDAIGESNSTFRGDAENISSFTLVKPDKTYVLTVGTTKTDDQWVITSISVDEQLRQ